MKRLAINKQTFVFMSVALLLILAAGLRSVGLDRDSPNYAEMLSWHLSIFNANFGDKEPFFWIIYEINARLFNFQTQPFFMMFAVIGVSVKMLAIKRSSVYPYLGILTYICLYFVLHEMTQIRAGVAAGIFLLALDDLVKRNWKSYVLKTFLAMGFHYSAAIMFAVYFLNPKRINRDLYLLLPIVACLLAVFKDATTEAFLAFIQIFPAFISDKFVMYIHLLQDGHFADINIFNFYYLCLIGFYYIFLLNIEKLNNPAIVIYVKLLGISLFSFYGFSFLPVFAFRTAEFLGVVLILLLPNFVLLFKQKLVAGGVLVFWLVFYFLAIMVRANLNI